MKGAWFIKIMKELLSLILIAGVTVPPSIAILYGVTKLCQNDRCLPYVYCGLLSFILSAIGLSYNIFY